MKTFPQKNERGVKEMNLTAVEWRPYRQVLFLSNGSRELTRIASLLQMSYSDVEYISRWLFEMGFLEFRTEEDTVSFDPNELKTSWDMVGDDNAKDVFLERMYHKLIYKHPDVSLLFRKTNLQEQVKALRSTLNMVIGTCDRLEQLIGPLQTLGRRHAIKGVKSNQFVYVGEAIIETFQEVLKDRFTQSMQTSWEVAYGIISDVMIAAMKEVLPENKK